MDIDNEAGGLAFVARTVEDVASALVGAGYELRV